MSCDKYQYRVKETLIVHDASFTRRLTKSLPNSRAPANRGILSGATAIARGAKRARVSRGKPEPKGGRRHEKEREEQKKRGMHFRRTAHSARVCVCVSLMRVDIMSPKWRFIPAR